MAHKQEQNIRFLQKFALTTQMRHSLQLLGMSATDLNEYIDTVLSTNPLLEKQTEEKPYKTDLTPIRKSSALHTSSENIDIEQEVTSRQDLFFQIRTLGLKKKDLEIAEYLVYEMNEDGYIKVAAEEAAGDLCVDIENIEKVIDVIQQLDPPGIGARDIRECLLIQLERQEKKDSLAYRIVSEFLSDLAINDTISISRALRIDKKQILEATSDIKSLNPRPGSTLMGGKTDPVIPDLVATVKNKKIRLEINRRVIPSLRLYNPYLKELDIVKDPKAKEFLKKNTKAANQLLDNIKRREETMCRIAYYMLDFRQDNIEQNKPQVKILTIQDLSKALNMHASTVSRTLSNKYIEVNDKVIPLKNLLAHGLKNKNGMRTSKTYIKDMILKLVKNENKARPLSDTSITAELNNEGILIKRRTVAKYRESLRILPTYLRKDINSSKSA